MTICARILPTSTIINDSRQCKNRKELRSPSPFLARPNSSVGVICRSQIPQACPGVSLFGVCIVHHHRYALRPHCQCPPHAVAMSLAALFGESSDEDSDGEVAPATVWTQNNGVRHRSLYCVLSRRTVLQRIVPLSSAVACPAAV